MTATLATGAELAGGADGPKALAPLLAVALGALATGARLRGGPVPRGRPDAIAAAVAAAVGDPLPATGAGADRALGELATVLAAGTADPADPRCAGHLHCPPLAVAVAAEVVAAALNPSLDSWDQGPSATELEPHVVRALTRLVGYAAGTGVLTSGGTESNLMGLLLARGDARRLRIFCSELAHFSVRRNAGILGLGEDAVTAVPADAAYRLDLAALRQHLAPGDLVVATAGTTDLGSIDPLPEITALCAERGARCHVDAAYGGGALFSDRLAPLLAGLERADSVALDLHKLGWQPVAAGVFLARDAAGLDPLARRVAYLNPADDEDAGYPSLLGHSLRTTRRVDAFKIAVTFRALGRDGLGRLVDACHDLARHAAAQVVAHPDLELAAGPVLTTVVFRHRGGDAVNAGLRRRLLERGTAVVGRTELDGAVWLKLTLLNPYATTADVDALLGAVTEEARA